jgi:hypothetical protein
MLIFQKKAFIWMPVLVAFTSLNAYAQLSTDPSLKTGIRLGDIVIHSTLGVQNGWTFNPGHTDAKRTVHDFITSVTAGVNTGFNRTQYQLGLNFALQYQQYWGAENVATKHLSNLSFNGGYNFTLKPKSKLSFSSATNVARSAGPANQTITRRLQHTTTTTTATVNYRPGGQALTFALSYGFMFDYFDKTEDIPNASQLGRMSHMPRLAISWRFLPRTTLFFENMVNMSYFKDSTGEDAVNSDSLIYTAALGLDSIITKKLSVTARAGYTGTFLESTGYKAPISTWIGQGEIRYTLDAKQTLSMGYARSIQPTSLYQYFGSHRVYTGYGLTFAEKFQAGAQLSYHLIHYGQALRNSDPGTREDHRMMLGMSLGYAIRSWINVSISENVDYRISNAVTQLGNAGYFHNTCMLGVQVSY